MIKRFINLSCLVFLGLSSIASAEVEYNIIPLFSESNQTTQTSPIINNSGYVVGTVSNKNTPFVYHEDIGFRAIKNLSQSNPKGVNKHGMVVGDYGNSKRSNCFFI